MSIADWKSMKTAPKDGTAILIHLKSGRCVVAYWRKQWSMWGTDAGSFEESNMLHWHPLPKLPAPPLPIHRDKGDGDGKH